MISFITSNQNKFREAKMVLNDIEQLDIDLPEIQSMDAKEVIKAKLQEAQKYHQGEFVVEDISLHMDCLNGLPGPLIKWFLKTIGVKGLADITKKYGNNKAEAKVVLGLYRKGEISFFESTIHGQIVAPRGESGFGWDPIFQPEGFDQTYAEVVDKDKIGMVKPRKLAFTKLKEFLNGKS